MDERALAALLSADVIRRRAVDLPVYGYQDIPVFRRIEVRAAVGVPPGR